MKCHQEGGGLPVLPCRREVLEFLEEHDPGIIQRMIQNFDAFADKSQASRFRFGDRQA